MPFVEYKMIQRFELWTLSLSKIGLHTKSPIFMRSVPLELVNVCRSSNACLVHSFDLRLTLFSHMQ